MKKIFTCLWLAALTFMFPFSCKAEKIDRIAAVVNTEVITEDELGLFERMAMLDDEAEPAIKDPKEMRAYFLERMIEDKLILQEAKRMQLKLDEQAIEDRVRDIRFRAGSEAAFQQALVSQGITLAEFREKLKNQLLIYMAVQREVRRKSLVSPKEVTEYYEKHRENFMVPDSLIVESIFVEDNQSLREVMSKISRGADFAEVGKDYSKRGSIGKVSRGQLKKELEDFVFSLNVGVPSKPFAIDNGYYIFLVKERVPAVQKDLDEVKDKVAAMVENEKAELVLKSWLEELKDKAYISIRQ